MYRTAVKAFCLVVAWAEVITVAGLVTQAPHNHTRVVTVTHYHTVDAVNESRNPRLAVRNALVGVVFEVSLVAAVQTVVVEHCVHLGSVRVVACTYSVDVVLLHENYILQHRLSCNGTAIYRVSVVTVHALEEYAFAVDVNE